MTTRPIPIHGYEKTRVPCYITNIGSIVCYVEQDTVSLKSIGPKVSLGMLVSHVFPSEDKIESFTIDADTHAELVQRLDGQSCWSDQEEDPGEMEIDDWSASDD